MEETLIASWVAAPVKEPHSTTLAKIAMPFNRSILHPVLMVFAVVRQNSWFYNRL
ncbi:hypothetical protein ETAR_03310 [Edwardsiella tarda]